mmetsp:Transcript_15132/g.28182  ORF Transcript_15132/g.28182 Transcript_15132/m.28182 type:complete len:370 (-) Transcript_15132:1082-2191(-)
MCKRQRPLFLLLIRAFIPAFLAFLTMMPKHTQTLRLIATNRYTHSYTSYTTPLSTTLHLRSPLANRAASATATTTAAATTTTTLRSSQFNSFGSSSSSSSSSSSNNDKDKLTEDMSTIQQKIEVLTLQSHKAREGISELASYIGQCIFEKRINRYYYTDNPHEHHGFHLHEHKKVGVLANGIGGALIDSIFKAFDDIEGGATSAKLSFGRVLETLLEHLTNVKCGFSMLGAKKLLKDVEMILEWGKSFDHKHGTDCALSPALDRAHAILVILTEPSTSVRTPELLLCIEQLPDLEVWLALRIDRGRVKGNAGVAARGVATLSGGHRVTNAMSGHLSAAKDSEKSGRREPKVKIKISKRIMQLIRDSGEL